MLDPLSWDIGAFLLSLAVAGAAGVLGLRLHRQSAPLRYGLIALMVSPVVLLAIGLAGFLPFAVWSVISLIGGGRMLLSWSAIFLVAAAWHAPGRSFTTPFLRFLVAVALLLVMLEAGGRMWWRSFAAAVWENRADKLGMVRQSSGVTCSPAAAVMLLDRYGVPASEGEMAYLAGTSAFGSEAFAMARALARKVEAHGWTARALRSDYEARRQTDRPFIAHLHGVPLGGHAVLVESVQAESVLVCDPSTGQRERVRREVFENAWDGTVIEILADRPAGTGEAPTWRG